MCVCVFLKQRESEAALCVLVDLKPNTKYYLIVEFGVLWREEKWVRPWFTMSRFYPTKSPAHHTLPHILSSYKHKIQIDTDNLFKDNLLIIKKNRFMCFNRNNSCYLLGTYFYDCKNCLFWLGVNIFSDILEVGPWWELSEVQFLATFWSLLRLLHGIKSIAWVNYVWC